MVLKTDGRVEELSTALTTRCCAKDTIQSEGKKGKEKDRNAVATEEFVS